MTAEGAEFVDTNILVYAFDSSAGAKHTAARDLTERLWHSETGRLSVQVLQEFYITITRKVAAPLPVAVAADRIREFANWKVFAPTANDVVEAMALQQAAQLNFWDAMIVRAAIESQCDVLWTEDLSDGQVIHGVQVRNPFV